MARKPNLDPGSAQVDLSGIQEGAHPLVLDGPSAALCVDSGADLWLRDYRFEGSVLRTDRDYRVRGSLTGILESVCDRCLVRFDREVATDTDVLATASALPGRESAEDREELDDRVVLPPGSTLLDLSGSFREATLLAIPIKNVCRDDCRGICPVCGLNRNEESCTCDTSGSDPRWDALRGLPFPTDPKE